MEKKEKKYGNTTKGLLRLKILDRGINTLVDHF